MPRDGLLEGAAGSEVPKRVGAGRRHQERNPWPGVLELKGGPPGLAGVYLWGAPVGALQPGHGKGCEEARVTGVSGATIPVRGQPGRGPGSGLGPCLHTPLCAAQALTAGCRGRAAQPGSQGGEASRDPACWGCVCQAAVPPGGLWAGRGRYGLAVRSASTLEAHVRGVPAFLTWCS